MSEKRNSAVIIDKMERVAAQNHSDSGLEAILF